MNDEQGGKLEANVAKFLAGAEQYYAKSAAEDFSQEMWNNCVELVKSPIERLLWIALHAVCKVNCVEINAEPWYDGKEERQGFGLHVVPQLEIEPYRVDFLVWNEVHKQATTDWVIECDGHEFHERTKAERQYEKKRDRFLTTRGYKILRFTGSEIFKDPYSVAVEIIRAVSGDDSIVTPAQYWEE